MLLTEGIIMALTCTFVIYLIEMEGIQMYIFQICCKIVYI